MCIRDRDDALLDVDALDARGHRIESTVDVVLELIPAFLRLVLVIPHAIAEVVVTMLGIVDHFLELVVHGRGVVGQLVALVGDQLVVVNDLLVHRIAEIRPVFLPLGRSLVLHLVQMLLGLVDILLLLGDVMLSVLLLGGNILRFVVTLFGQLMLLFLHVLAGILHLGLLRAAAGAGKNNQREACQRGRNPARTNLCGRPNHVSSSCRLSNCNGSAHSQSNEPTGGPKSVELPKGKALIRPPEPCRWILTGRKKNARAVKPGRPSSAANAVSRNLLQKHHLPGLAELPGAEAIEIHARADRVALRVTAVPRDVVGACLLYTSDA